MLRITLIITLLVGWPCATLAADISIQIQAAHTYLHNGNPEQAVITARRVLKQSTLTPPERLALLATIAQAETLSTTHRRYQHVDTATQAIETLLQEFPDSPDAAEFRWQRTWLWWKAGNSKRAIASAREIIAQDQQPANLRRAWLLMTRAHLQLKNYAYARSDLLQYGLQVAEQSRDQAVGMAWMAIVDQGESRSDAAFQSLQHVYRTWPEVITDEAELFATYIDLLHQRHQNKTALALSDRFIEQYSQTAQSARIRLIRANIHAADEASIPLAIKEYTILARQQAETSIGRKAFMRKVMLEFRHEQNRDKLLPVMIALKKIADENQLSTIEDEAMLNLARLWTRIQINRPKNDQSKSRSPTHPAKHPAPAMEAYARAATSLNPAIARAARTEGAVWLKKYTTTLLQQQQWLAAMNIWRQYPQLRPGNSTPLQLRLAIAHAMRMLMLFDAAEELLAQLYKDNSMSISGQRIMMERAKLWMDRQDPAGVKKIMRWLNRHEFSIYRPEMLLIVARMQLAMHQPDLARQTLVSVQPADIAVEARASYWKTSAAISEALSEWHRAASAWEKYRHSPSADAEQGLIHQADNLFAAGEFAAARKLYQQVPEAKQDSAWQYHIGVCQLRSGELKQGTERLQQLATMADGDRYSTLAKLALADQQAKKLLGEPL